MANEPYQKINQRVDVIWRLPSWAKQYVKVGEYVKRIDSGMIKTFAGVQIALKESYTKFSHYTPLN